MRLKAFKNKTKRGKIYIVLIGIYFTLKGGKMIESKIYNVGIYIRLSREDEKANKLESESITNQRNTILDYINTSNENFKIYDEYVDDGISGTTFDRPSFKRLISDIEKGLVNCVITKDYSRLGRDYIKSGEYVDIYFPEHNIRYIAILDGMDSKYDSASNDFAPFKAVFNDQYAKDISKKVRASVTTKKKKGDFLGWKAVYGYKLDENNRYKIVIDEEAAKVVRRIFDMASRGMGDTIIANILTREKIPIPSVYANLNRGRKSSAYGIWCSRTVGEMLTNETYIGNMTQGKRRVINYKIKKDVRVPKENWIIVENTHEPIIDKKTFDTVQLIRDKCKNTKENDKPRLLRGFLYCQECGHSLSISNKKDGRAYLGCSYYQRYSKFHLCTPHTMNYFKLEELVLKEIRSMCKKYIKTNKFEAILKNSSKRNKLKNRLIGEINSCKLEKERLQENKSKVYFDKVNEIITLDEYKEYSNKIVNDIVILDDKLNNLNKELSILEDKVIPDNEYTKIVKEYLSFKKPNKAMLAHIIDKISIDKNKQITIKYRIKNPN